MDIAGKTRVNSLRWFERVREKTNNNESDRWNKSRGKQGEKNKWKKV